VAGKAVLVVSKPREMLWAQSTDRAQEYSSTSSGELEIDSYIYYLVCESEQACMVCIGAV
jgi:hypothetical protein